MSQGRGQQQQCLNVAVNIVFSSSNHNHNAQVAEGGVRSGLAEESIVGSRKGISSAPGGVVIAWEEAGGMMRTGVAITQPSDGGGIGLAELDVGCVSLLLVAALEGVAVAAFAGPPPFFDALYRNPRRGYND